MKLILAVLIAIVATTSDANAEQLGCNQYLGWFYWLGCWGIHWVTLTALMGAMVWFIVATPLIVAVLVADKAIKWLWQKRRQRLEAELEAEKAETRRRAAMMMIDVPYVPHDHVWRDGSPVSAKDARPLTREEQEKELKLLEELLAKERARRK
jgi:hypothetical protein